MIIYMNMFMNSESFSNFKTILLSGRGGSYCEKCVAGIDRYV